MIQEFKSKYQELAEKKRAELEGALDRREVADPVSIGISIAISVALSAASYVVAQAFAPKPPKQTIGKLQGNLQLQNSEQGIMIPEIYGAGPAASLVAGASPTYQNLTNTTGGANGSITKTSGANNNYNAGASHNATVATGQDAFIRVIRGTGFAAAGFFNTASPTGSGPDATGMIFGVAWHNAGPFYAVVNGVGLAQGNTVSGDTFTIEVRSGRFRLYKNSAEITTFGSPVPAQPATMWFGVIMYTTGAGVSNCKIKIDAIGDTPNQAKGGVKVPAIIDWSSGIRKNVSVTQTQVGGKGFGGGQSQTTENITYDIDLGLTFCRGPVDLLRLYANADVLIDQTDTSLLLTGAYDPTTGADADYDPEVPPDPRDDYVLALERSDGDIPFDGDGVGTGSVQGGGSGFAVYSGTETQDPDPTEEADIDAKYGTGSTTAHRGKSRVVLGNFDLSRWGGMVPNMTAAWENPTLATLDDIYASLCERVNVKVATSDYDFSGISTIQPRGMLIAGRLFSPAEVMGSPDIQTVYNYFVTEAEGQIVSFIEGAEPTVTIADTEIGWMDSDAEVADILPEVDTVIASEIGLAREVHVKYIDLDKDWEPNTQSDNRQITEGVSTEVVEVQLAMLADEARTAAQRQLYRNYVAGSAHKFTLPWTYLYLYPGYKVTITRAEGFNHVLKLTSISGGLGVIECEGVAIEPAAYTQPAVGSIILGNPPPQSVPAMTILTLLDTPLLRDGDETNNNGVGFYACGTPRTGVGQSWVGFALYRNRNSVWGIVGSSDLPGTIGKIVSAVGISSDTTGFDTVGVFTVDLYGTSASLSSSTQDGILADRELNLALFGNMVSQFVTVAQVPDFPNRWTISVLLNGRRGTEDHVGDTFTDARFVLIDAAVKFVPIQISDLSNLMEYRAVTSGQSLADAATLDFVWEGGTLQPYGIVNPRGDRGSDDGLLVEFEGRSRVGGGVRSLQSGAVNEEIEEYRVQILDGGSEILPNGLTRIIPVLIGAEQRAVLNSDSVSGKFGGVVAENTLDPALLDTNAISLQQILATENYITGTLHGTGAVPIAQIGFIPTNTAEWRGQTYAQIQAKAHIAVQFNDTSSGGSGLTIFEFGVSVYNAAASADQRIRIEFTGTVVRVYSGWTGPGSVPLYESPIAPVFPVMVIAQAEGQSSVEGIVMTTAPFPKAIYTAAEQTEDGFTPGDPVEMDIWQHSRLVGPGVKTRVTL